MDKFVREFFGGNIAMAGCCIFYLIWWSIAFKPNTDTPKVKAAVLFILTAICGIGGLAAIIRGIQSAAVDRQLFSDMAVVLSGVILYVLLLFVTSHFMHRQITTELLLIIGWGVLTFCEMNALYGCGVFTGGFAILGCIVALIFVIAGMVCYLAYYQLEPMKAYVDGMVPLILVGIYMAGTAIKILV